MKTCEWFTVPYPLTEADVCSPNRSRRAISSAGASPAKTSASPARAPGSRGPDLGCGGSCGVSFAMFDPDSSCWRTYQRSLFGGLTLYSERWPDSGTMLSGRCYRRPRWEPRIFVGGSSSSRGYPTPRAPLTGRWPTATAGDAKGSGSRNLEGSKAHAGVSLTDAVRFGNSNTPRRWSTPCSRDHKDSGANVDWAKIAKRGKLAGQAAGSLNPAWVELLMGFPPGHTEAPIPKNGSEG